MSRQSRARSRRHSQKNAGRATTTKQSSTAKAENHPKHVGTMALWIATPFGVLMPGMRPPHTYDAGTDNRSLQVRTRQKEYLDRFRELYCPELGEANHFPHHDYPWKAYVSPDDLARAVARMVLDTDSEVFKPLTDGPKGLKDKGKANSLHGTYSSWWSSHLHDDDKPSWKEWKGSSSGHSWTRKAPARCAQWGHWFVDSEDWCLDCDEPKPAGWNDGDPPVYPVGPVSVTTDASGVITPVFPAGVTPDNFPAKKATVTYGLGEPHEEADNPPWEYGADVEGDSHGWTDPNEDDDLTAALIAAQERDGMPDDYDAEYDPASAGRCPECTLGNGVHRTDCGRRHAEVRRLLG